MSAHHAIAVAGEWRPDLLEEHLEELSSFWARRPQLLSSPEAMLKDLRRFDRRLMAHLDALVLAGDNAEGVLLDALDSEDADTVQAAASVLLVSAKPDAVRMLWERLPTADAQTFEGLIRAFRLGPHVGLLPLAERALSAPGSEVEVAVAAMVLARAGKPFAPAPLAPLLGSRDPKVLEPALDCVSEMGLPWSRTAFEALAAECSPSFLERALIRAAHGGHRWVLDFLREKAGAPTREDVSLLELYALLEEPAQAARVVKLASDERLGPGRMALLGLFGHPSGMEPLVRTMSAAALATADTAARAFLRITGVDVRTDVRVDSDAEGAEPGTEERVNVPDAALAAKTSSQLQSELKSAARIVAGRDCGASPFQPDDDTVSLGIRGQEAIAARFRKSWAGRPSSLEALTVPWPSPA